MYIYIYICSKVITICTSGVWCCVYLVQLLWIPREIEHTYSVLQHNHYPVWGRKEGGGGGGGVSVFIVQTSDRKPMECVNYLIAVYMW